MLGWQWKTFLRYKTKEKSQMQHRVESSFFPEAVKTGQVNPPWNTGLSLSAAIFAQISYHLPPQVAPLTDRAIPAISICVLGRRQIRKRASTILSHCCRMASAVLRCWCPAWELGPQTILSPCTFAVKCSTVMTKLILFLQQMETQRAFNLSSLAASDSSPTLQSSRLALVFLFLLNALKGQQDNIFVNAQPHIEWGHNLFLQLSCSK